MNALVLRWRGLAIVCLLCCPVEHAVLLVLLVFRSLQACRWRFIYGTAECWAVPSARKVHHCSKAHTCESLLPKVKPIGPSRSPRPPNLPGLRVPDSLEARVHTERRQRPQQGVPRGKNACCEQLPEQDASMTKLTPTSGDLAINRNAVSTTETTRRQVWEKRDVVRLSRLKGACALRM